MNKQQQEINLVKHNIGTLHNSKHYDQLQNVDSFLSTEKKETSFCKPWTRLNKMQKMQKLNEFAIQFQKKHDFDDERLESLKSYLRKALDQKKITKKNDIVYDSEKCIVTDIPNLQYNKISPRGKHGRFTIKASTSSGKNSTLKNLGIVKKKKKKRSKIEKNNELEN